MASQALQPAGIQVQQSNAVSSPLQAQTHASSEGPLMDEGGTHTDVPLFGTYPPKDAALFRLRTPSDTGSPGSPQFGTRVLPADPPDGLRLAHQTRTRSSDSSPAPDEAAKEISRRRRRSHTPNDPTSPLIADVQLSRSRILISKTHVLYPQPSAICPWRAAVLGFRAVFHPLSATRIKEAEITITFLPPMGEPAAAPIIKALAPAHLVTGDGAKVNKTSELSGALTLGYDPFANLNLGISRTTDISYTAHASVIGSGIETSLAVFTLQENPQSHGGLDPSMDFALLLYLPSRTTSYFEAELIVEANVGRDSFGEYARRLLGSPRAYRLTYDGETEMGTLRISP